MRYFVIITDSNNQVNYCTFDTQSEAIAKAIKYQNNGFKAVVIHGEHICTYIPE